MILLIRTDDKEAYVGLADDTTVVQEETWLAHRQLSDTLLLKIEGLLQKEAKTWSDLGGIAVFKGPGSFTGLRIGATVANTLSDSLKIPIVGTAGANWAQDALRRLVANENDRLILPEYGAEANITKPRK